MTEIEMEDDPKHKLIYLTIRLEYLARKLQKSYLLDDLFIHHRLDYLEVTTYYYFLEAYHSQSGLNRTFRGKTPIAEAISKILKSEEHAKYLKFGKKVSRKHGSIPTSGPKLFPIVQRLIDKGVILRVTNRKGNGKSYVPWSTIETQNLGLTGEYIEKKGSLISSSDTHKLQRELLKEIISSTEIGDDDVKKFKILEKKTFDELESRCKRALRHMDFTFYSDFLSLFSERDLQEYLDNLRNKNRKTGGARYVKEK